MVGSVQGRFRILLKTQTPGELLRGLNPPEMGEGHKASGG